MENAASNGDKASSMVCVHCGHSAELVYVEYSPGNIRLSTCARCHLAVDEYVECEAMIVIIDTILHKPEGYRHLFFNYPKIRHLNLLSLVWRATLLFLLLDTCRYALHGEIIQWDSLTSFVYTTGKVVAEIISLNCGFLAVLVLASRSWPKTSPDANSPWTRIFLAVLFSSHFKLIVFAMLVWEFSPLMSFMVDILVLSSNTVAVRVMCNTNSFHAAAAVIAAGAVKMAMATLIGFPGARLFEKY